MKRKFYVPVLGLLLLIAGHGWRKPTSATIKQIRLFLVTPL